MRMFKKLIHDNKGMALPMALVMLVMVGMMVVPVVSLINTNIVSNRVSTQAIKKFYSVDTSVNYALWKMKYDTTDTALKSWMNNPSGTYNLTLPETINGIPPMTVAVVYRGIDPVTEDRTFSIESQASNDILQYDSQLHAFVTVPSSSRVKAYVAIDPGDSSSSIFKYALATLGGDFTMTGSVSIGSDPPGDNRGDVWINGDLNMAWSTSIFGDAAVAGELNCPNPNPNITGVLTEGADPPVRPTWLDDQAVEFEQSTLVSQPSLGGTCTSWNDIAAVYNDPICVSGNMSLAKSGTYRFNNTVHVTGNLLISGSNTIYFEKTVRVDGYIYINGSGNVYFENSGDGVLWVGKYLRCEGSRPVSFGGKISALGATLYNNYAIYFDGTGDAIFHGTVRSGGNAKFGSSRNYEFNDTIYTTGNITFDGSSASESLEIKAIVAEGSITVAGSAQFISEPEVAPFLISRKVGCCTTDTSCNGVTLSGSTPVTAIVYAPDSRAWVSGSSAFEGAMVAKCAQLDGSATLKYPVVLDNREDIENPSEGETIVVTSYYYE